MKYFFKNLLNRIMKVQIVQKFCELTLMRKLTHVSAVLSVSIAVNEAMILTFNSNMPVSLRLKGLGQAICCVTALTLIYISKLIKNTKGIFYLKLASSFIAVIYGLLGGDMATFLLMSAINRSEKLS